MKKLSHLLLEDVLDDTDLALDYIEHEIGANRFVANWSKLKAVKNPVTAVQQWLDAIGDKGNAAEIVKIIDDLAAKDTKWLTPFTSPIPPGE